MTHSELTYEDLSDGEGDINPILPQRLQGPGVIRRKSIPSSKNMSNLTLEIKPYEGMEISNLDDKIRTTEIKGATWLGSLITDKGGVKVIWVQFRLVDALVNPDTVREKIESFENEVASAEIITYEAV